MRAGMLLFFRGDTEQLFTKLRVLHFFRVLRKAGYMPALIEEPLAQEFYGPMVAVRRQAKKCAPPSRPKFGFNHEFLPSQEKLLIP